jgi:hypothetical protein
VSPRDRDRPSLGALLGAGGRAVGHYTGTVLAVFVAQTLLAGAAMIGVALILAQAFALHPRFDDAVDGDLVALIAVVRHAKVTFAAIGGLGVAVLLLWQVTSWFLAGGLYGVLATRPEGRAPTARCFGGAGAATYLAYARLALCALPARVLALIVFGLCVGAAAPRIGHALVPADLVGPLALALGPVGLLLHLQWTIDDYARIELTLRRDDPPSAVKTYVRATGYVITHPITLLHAALGWLGWLAITALYMALAQGRPMYGAGGALTLLVIRLGVALARHAIRVAILAGQVELGRTLVRTPRTVTIA